MCHTESFDCAQGDVLWSVILRSVATPVLSGVEGKNLVSSNQAAYHVRNETLRYRSG